MSDDPAANAKRPTDRVLQRLRFGKFLIERARNALDGTGLLAPAVAVSALQDGVELILRAVGEHLGATTTPVMSFNDIIAAVDKVGAGLKVPYKAALLGLNASRVNFKHLGNLPVRADVEGYLRSAESFAREALSGYFDGLGFDSISLAELVQHRRCQNALRDAEGKLSAGELDGALRACDRALAVLFRRVRRWTLSRERPGSSSAYGSLKDREAGMYLGKLHEDLDTHDTLLVLLLEGVDLSRYRRFVLLVPARFGSAPRPKVFGSGGYARSADDVRFCIDFVMETALRLQDNPRTKLFGQDSLPRYRVTTATNIVVSHTRPEQEVIREATVGEELVGYPSYDTGGWHAVLQDDDCAYILANAVEVLGPGPADPNRE
jgi:hypothetical protein